MARRIFVHESIFDELLSKLVEATKKLSVGDPEEPNTFMGAINSREHLEKIRRWVEEGGKRSFTFRKMCTYAWKCACSK